MTLVRIPESPVAISRLGLGCARLSGGPELRSSARIIEAALKYGVRHFDTAPSYGSEDVLGAVLGEMRDVTVATKVGLPRTTGSSASGLNLRSLYRRTVRPVLGYFPAVKSRLLRTMPLPPARVGTSARRHLERDVVLRELETSLERLNRSRVDLYMIHEPEQFVLTDDLRELFESLQRDGVIGAFGLAHGALPSAESLSFGSVEQCRYSDDLCAVGRADTVRIFHGVLRYGLRGRQRTGRPAEPGRLIARVLAEHGNCAVVFSASSEHQIGQVVQQHESATSV